MKGTGTSVADQAVDREDALRRPAGGRRGSSSTQGGDIVDRIWRTLSSQYLALILILAIAAASLFGTLLMQVPGWVTTAADYSAWMQQARLKYGPIADVLSALGLFAVFNTYWFRLLLGLLTLNISVCTLDRWHGIWQSIAHPRVRMGESFFRQAGKRADWISEATSADGAGEQLGDALRQRKYRVLTETDDSAAYVYADKNRFGKLGSIFSHLSIVLILAGTIVGGVWGFRNNGFVVPEGSVRSVGYDTHLSVKLEDFADEYYPEGPPKDFRSDVVLYENGAEVKRATIRVNEPLDYGGVSFHQAFFGPAASVEVRDKQGTVLFSDSVGLAWQQDDGRSLGSFSVTGRSEVAYLVAPLSGQVDPLIPAGQLALEVYRDSQARTPAFAGNLVQGSWTAVGDLEYRFVQESQFTGLQVVYDPGTPVIWAACALLVLGIFAVFYFPHRRIWALCRSSADGTTQVLLGSPGKGSMSEEDWLRLTDDLQAQGRQGAAR